MVGRTLQIAYVGDAKSVLAAQKQIDAGHTKLQGSTTKTGSTMKNVFGSVIPGATFLTVAGIGLAAKAIVDAATTEAEAQNQVNVIFGESVDVINKFAEQSATSAGISKGAALEAAGGFGAMLKSAGLAQAEAANLSVSIVQLAGDLASFKNVAPEEALEKLRSGLAGEAEPLRQFGVFLSEAAVQAEAYKSGIAEVGTELTEAQKVQARYNIILKQTKDAHGDFGETLGESLPNQLRALKAQVTDIAADFGKLLLPVLVQLTKVVGLLADNLPVVVAAFGTFATLKYLPGLLLQIAAGFEAIGATALASAFLSTAAGVASVGAMLVAAAPPALAFAAAFGGVTAAVAAWDPLGLVDDTDKLRASMEVHGVVLGRVARETYLVEGATQAAAQSLAEQQQKAALAAAGITNLTGSTEAGADSQDRYGREAAETTEELREQRLAVLALSGSFLGIAGSAADVAEAQRELNRLEQKGKEDTKAYEQAVLDALEAQIGLEDAVLSYGKELVDSGQKQKDVEGKIRDLGREFGIQKGIIDDLIGRLREYIGELNRVPNKVDTHVTTYYDKVGTPGRALQHGGVVTRPTVALIGEAGPEAVIPLSKAGRGTGVGGPTIHLHIGTVVGPGGVEEVADILRRELQKTGVRNVTTGLV